VKKLDLADKGPVLLLGWGGDAYRNELARRWPDLALEIRNPLVGSDPLPASQDNEYGAVMLSGLIARSAAEEERTFQASVATLKGGGLLLLHDAILPSGANPPEVALGMLGRHLTCRPCGSRSVNSLRTTLESLGLRDMRVEYVPGGTLLITALKGATDRVER